MTQVIRLLSDPHANIASKNWEGTFRSSSDTGLHSSLPTSDPFSSGGLTYSTTGTDSFPAPSAYRSRRFSWVHIFPEGMIHQHPDKVMRYFKWGVARLILEAEPCPDVLPMWIDGPQHIMDNNRPWPRPLPRVGKDVTVTFGDLVDTEKVFGPFRQRWRDLKAKATQKRLLSSPEDADSALQDYEALGEVVDDELRYGREAQQLRIDVTLAVRNEVLRVRRACGLPDEDPKRSLAETFRAEGGRDTSQEGKKEDGSVVKEM